MDDALVKRLAVAVRQEISTFKAPAPCYIGGEAEHRWEVAHPGEDAPEDRDWDIEDYAIIVRAVLSEIEKAELTIAPKKAISDALAAHSKSFGTRFSPTCDCYFCELSIALGAKREPRPASDSVMD